MANGSKAVQAKQPIVIDAEAFKSSLQGYQGEFDEVKSAPIMVFDNESFKSATQWIQRAKNLEAKFNDTFKPVDDSLKAAGKALKAALSVFTEPLAKFQVDTRQQCEEYLRLNKEAKPEGGRIQGGQWKMEVTDEEALLRSMVIATNKKDPETGKMFIDIQFNPQIRALFPYNQAKGNALAGVINTTMKLPGTKISQSDHFTLASEK